MARVEVSWLIKMSLADCARLCSKSADASVPIDRKYVRGRIRCQVLVRVPKCAIIVRIDRDRTVITPAITEWKDTGVYLNALTEKHHCFALGQFIYGITAPLVAPFYGLFGNPSAQGSVLELHSLVALIVYALLAWLLGKLAWILVGDTRSAVKTRSTEIDSRA